MQKVIFISVLTYAVVFAGAGVCLAGPVIVVEPNDLNFEAVEGGDNPAAQILYISNAGTGKLEWAVEPNGLCEWIEIEPASGSCVDETDEVTIGVDTAGLGGGYYICELIISDPDAENSPQFFVVNLRVFDGDGLLHVPGEYPTIQSAVDAADVGETVIVADGTYTGEGNRDITIEKAITVQSENGAENCIIDCEGTEVERHRGFVISNVADGKVIIEGFSVINGYIYDRGGAIYCFESSVSIDECSFTNNTGNSGGAVSFSNCNEGIISGCEFTDNTAGNGGAVYCSSEGDIEIADCEFTGNQAEGEAGALLCYRGNITVQNCRFESNTAVWWGGAVSSSDNAWVGIDNCEIISNSASEGGGVAVNQGKITNCTIKNNTVDGIGGGILGFNVWVDSCLIVGNEAEHSGGGIRIWCERVYYCISNCTIVGNVAWRYGGGISVSGDYGFGIITNSIIWGNGGSDGRELNVWFAPVVIDNCNIGTDEFDICTEIPDLDLGANSIDAEPEFVDAHFFDPNIDPGDPYYGLLIVEDAHLQAGSTCVDAGCNDTVMGLERFDIGGQVRLLDGDGDGEAVVDMGAYEFAPEGEAVIATDEERIYFTFYESGERTGQQALKIYNTGNGVLQWQLTEDCDWLEADIYSGTADANGIEVTFSVDAMGLETGVYTCEIEIIDNDALNNSAVVTAVLYVVPDAGLWVPFHYETIQAAVDAAADFETVLIADGTYMGDGNRDIYVNKPITIKGATDAKHCVINSAGEYHRVFYLDGVDPNCVLEGVTVSGGNCPTSPGGAGIYCVGSAIIRDCAITNNVAVPGRGGGIYFEGGGGKVEGCVIRGNIAEYRGGGIYCYSSTGGTVEIIGSVIADNVLIDDYNYGDGAGVSCAYCDLTIIDSRIEHNYGRGLGGGVRVGNDNNATIIDSVISDNTADTGGGIFATNNCNLEITGCTIKDNSGSGGGIFAIENCIVDITNSEVSYNTASTDGTAGISDTCAALVYEWLGPWPPLPLSLGAAGGISTDNSQLNISNCVITGNEGIAGGIRCCAGDVLLADSVIVENIGMGLSTGLFSLGAGEVEISRCIFSNNMAIAGRGGIYCIMSDSVRISNCLVSGNDGSSGGAVECFGNNSNVITNCTVVGNRTRWLTTNPGGIAIGGYYPHDPSAEACGYALVENCIVRDNRGNPDYTPKDNFVVACDNSEILYNNIEGGWDGIGYNVDAAPLFVEAGYWDPNDTPEDETDDFWVEGDYHLMWDSPCVDAGSPYFVAEPGATDVEGNARVLDGDNDGSAVVDMGAYERYPHDEPVLVVSEDQMSFNCVVGGAEIKEDTFEIRNQGAGTLQWQITESCDWLSVNPTEGTATTEIDEVVVTVDSSGLALGVYNCQLDVSAVGAENSPQVVDVNLYVVRYLVVPLDYPTIQAAIDAAETNDVVIVLDGVYTGEGNRDIYFNGKTITVQSENGPADCIIDCGGSEAEPHRGFLFANEEDAGSVLKGFTITNGFSNRGSGIKCNNSSPTIADCVLNNNYATEYAGGLWCRLSSPTITNCTFTENQAAQWGGAVCCYEDDNPVFEDCVFQGNIADSSGGGIYCQEGTVSLVDCIFEGNITNSSGGGIFSIDTDLTLSGCSFLGNNAMSGGGIRFRCEGILSLDNCVFAGNYSEYYGGGLHSAASYEDGLWVYINNCTFSGNDGGEGGAVYYFGTEMIIANSIFWANTDYQIGPLPTLEIELYYSDVQDYIDDEDYKRAYGNIDVDPNFVDTSSVDPADWDLHLMPFSPCRDAGQTAYVAPDTVDIDGEPRVIGGRVDMGADEVGQKQADFTRDGRIDIDDFSVLGRSWGAGPADEKWYVLSDLFEDGAIGLDDLAIFVDDWMWVAEWR